ncbi:multimeric flavodoxin WrbA [Metabacillus crassostreae]|uniref:flavodoxin family protein n=1 Tax=Metabacillus crassostreae TaxID=929098 RepID=UPI00195B4A35|nr:flavodoxin family protein [Metabacillus crassostreae]MBM7602740.1 multimeric flavodoxin WrbA [Metabacillus crassostreae]
MSIVVLHGSTRRNGNTETLTNQAVLGVKVEHIYLRDYEIKPIEDMRHEQSGFGHVNDSYNSIIERIMSHNILIFATPIYWYSMTGKMKNFVDRWSQTIRDKNIQNFKRQMERKKAFVIAVGGDEPSIKGLPLIQQFKYIFDFIGIDFSGYVLGKGNKPDDILNDHQAMCTASVLNKTLLELERKE